MTRSMTLVLAATAAACFASTEAFVVSSSTPNARATTELSASRRDFVLSGLVGAALTVLGDPAEASYSAYAAREQDWETRMEKGQVKISTARDLKRQLREIAPENSEASRIFCPNGPSAAVSPLMENRCGDQMAIPSVYGRTEDTVGNSIPGFKVSRYPSSMPGDSTSLTASPTVGGFPKYN